MKSVERFFWLVAALCLGTYGYFWAERSIYQWRQSSRFDATLKEPAPGRPETRPETSVNPLVGRIEIPRLRLSAIILEGVDDRTLQLGVGHLPGTAFPGQAGNAAVAGHRDTFFRPLRSIRKQDLIRLTTMTGVAEYAVESIAVVNPEDTEVLEPTVSPSLTLVTCYPFHYVGAAPQRFVVRAREIEARKGAPPVPQPRVRTTERRNRPKKSTVLPVAEQIGDLPHESRKGFFRTVASPFRKVFGRRSRRAIKERKE